MSDKIAWIKREDDEYLAELESIVETLITFEYGASSRDISELIDRAKKVFDDKHSAHGDME